jgi:hypothetical protein
MDIFGLMVIIVQVHMLMDIITEMVLMLVDIIETDVMLMAIINVYKEKE